jgi:aryl-alcohol dehydrogenase-like predicted oxidoreductase
MRYRTLGRTGLRVSEVSLGGLFFGKLADGRSTEATVRQAVDLGINLIDTAPAYTGSEEDLGQAWAGGLRRKFILCTKWWPYMGSGPGIRQNPADLRATVDRSLRRLRTDRIDVFFFHSLTFERDIDDVLNGPLRRELERLKRAGAIGYIGLSNSGDYDTENARLTEAARSGFFDVVMPEFNLFKQRAVRAALPVFTRHRIGVLSIMPLGQAAWGYGLRDRKYLEDSLKTLREKKALPDATPYTRADVLDFLLDAATPTIPAAALRYCLSYPEVSTVCCGTNNPDHLAENAAISAAGPYDAERLARAEELFGAL